METNYKNLKKHELPELERKGFFRRWYYMPTQIAVRKKEYYFSDDVENIKAILEKRQFDNLSKLTCKTLSPVELVVISTKDSRFAAAQVFRYQDYYFNPESEIMVFKDADAEAFLGVLKGLKPEG